MLKFYGVSNDAGHRAVDSGIPTRMTVRRPYRAPELLGVSEVVSATGKPFDPSEGQLLHTGGGGYTAGGPS